MASNKVKLEAQASLRDNLSPKLDGIQKKLTGFYKKLDNQGLADFSLGDVVTGGAFAAPFVGAARAAIDFESSMADVRKVVDFPTPEAFKEMNRDIIALSQNMPMAAQDIAAIVAAGGQAGIARKDLQQFASDAIKMRVAADMTADAAGDMMAKWRTAFKLSQNEVVDLADKINYLSNNTAASFNQIAGIVTRIGALGEVAGLASGELAAMGATLSGVGINEEVAATGMKNFMLSLTSGSSATKAQKQVWAALGFSSEGVAADMTKDAKATILKVLKTLKRVKPEKQAAVLAELFGRESIGAIAPLLTTLDELEKNFERVGSAAEWSGSMQKEYEARCKTTANALQLLKNRAESVGIAVGSVMLPPIVEATEKLGPFVTGCADFVQANPWIIKSLMGAAAAFTAFRVAAWGAALAMKFGAMIAGGPVAAGIKLAVLAVGALVANWEKVSEAVQKAIGWIRDFMNITPGDLLKAIFKSDFSLEDAMANGRSRRGDAIQSPLDQTTPVTESLQRNSQIGGTATVAKPLASSSPSTQTVEGSITVSLPNAPQGTRIENVESRGPVKLKTNVGYSYAYGGN